MAQNTSLVGTNNESKTHITIDYGGEPIEIETTDEKSVDVKTIQETFGCSEVKGLSYDKDGKTQK
jgi:hypothetical protein